MARIRIGKQTELSTVGGSVVITDILTAEQKYLPQGTTGQVLTADTVLGPKWTNGLAYTEKVDTFSPAAAQTTVTLTSTPQAGYIVDVYRNGIRQTLTTDYTIAGTTITFLVPFDASSGATNTELVNVAYEF